jgi:hypothetical protein
MFAEEARGRPTKISRNRTYVQKDMRLGGIRHEVFWVGLSPQWLNATHLKIFSMQRNENGLSRAPTTTTNAKPSSQFLQYHGPVPALRGFALPRRTSHALSHVDVTSIRTPKVKMQIAAIFFATSGSCSRTNPCETQSTFDVSPANVRERPGCFVSVVQFIYLTRFFLSSIASFSPCIVRCSSRYSSVSADPFCAGHFHCCGPKEEKRIEPFDWPILSLIAPLSSLPLSRHRRKKVLSRSPSELTPHLHPHPHPTDLQLPSFVLGPNPTQP